MSKIAEESMTNPLHVRVNDERIKKEDSKGSKSSNPIS